MSLDVPAAAGHADGHRTHARRDADTPRLNRKQRRQHLQPPGTPPPPPEQRVREIPRGKGSGRKGASQEVHGDEAAPGRVAELKESGLGETRRQYQRQEVAAALGIADEGVDSEGSWAAEALALPRRWVLTYMPPFGRMPKSESKATQIQQRRTVVLEIESVGDAQRLCNDITPPTQLRNGCDYSLFLHGIDQENTNTGGWEVSFPRKKFLVDDVWMRLVLALLGGEMACVEQVNACVVRVRKSGCRIALCTCDPTNQEVNERIRAAIQNIVPELLTEPSRCQIDFYCRIDFYGSYSRSKLADAPSGPNAEQIAERDPLEATKKNDRRAREAWLGLRQAAQSLGAGRGSDDEGDKSEPEGPAIELLLALLKSHGDTMAAAQCCSALYTAHPSCKAAVKAAGGIRALCEKHNKKLLFTSRRGGDAISVAVNGEPSAQATAVRKQKVGVKQEQVSAGAKESQSRARQHKSAHPPPAEKMLTFASYGNIRRLFGTLLSREHVYSTLSLAGYPVEKSVHKMGTNQSHGRWEIRCEGARFEVHLGFKDNKAPPNLLVDTIVQGLKGWTPQVLDNVAEALCNTLIAVEGMQEGQGHKRHGSKDCRVAFDSSFEEHNYCLYDDACAAPAEALNTTSVSCVDEVQSLGSSSNEDGCPVSAEELKALRGGLRRDLMSRCGLASHNKNQHKALTKSKDVELLLAAGVCRSQLSEEDKIFLKKKAAFPSKLLVLGGPTKWDGAASHGSLQAWQEICSMMGTITANVKLLLISFETHVESWVPESARVSRWEEFFKVPGSYVPPTKGPIELTLALASVVCPSSKSLSMLKNVVTHELCHVCLVQALRALLPGTLVEIEPPLVGKDMKSRKYKKKFPDIYLPACRMYLEIKTWLWDRKPDNQFKGFEFGGDNGLAVLFFEHGREKVRIQHMKHGGEQAFHNVVECIVDSVVFPVFQVWAEFVCNNRDAYKQHSNSKVE